MAGENMSILDIINIIFGLAFFAFIPGFLIVKLFFGKEEVLEKSLLSILFSIMIAISIGIFFGYDRSQAALTGGFTAQNLWIGELTVTGILLSILIIKETLMKKRSFTTKKRRKK